MDEQNERAFQKQRGVPVRTRIFSASFSSVATTTLRHTRMHCRVCTCSVGQWQAPRDETQAHARQGWSPVLEIAWPWLQGSP